MGAEGKNTITVLMTVFNGGDYLPLAIESVLKQTHADFEFVIVDDKSTDNSVEVIRSFDDKRIRLHCNEQNIGQTKSLNVGLNLAQGSYVARIDADDIADHQWLKTHVDFLNAHGPQVVVTTDAVVIDGDGHTKRFLKAPRDYGSMVLKSLIASPINHGGAIMHRETILSMGGYDEQYRIAADYDLWSRLMAEGHIFTHNEGVGMAIRFHEQSISLSEQKESVLPEAAHIMKKNVNAIAGIELSEEEIDSLWSLCYAAHRLTMDAFQSAIALFDRIYDTISSMHINPVQRDQFVFHQKRVFWIKRIFALAELENGEEMQATVIGMMNKYRKNLASWFIYFWSWMGWRGVKIAILIYNMLSLMSVSVKKRNVGA